MAKKSLAMKIENVSMKFNLSSEKVDNIKEYVIKMIKKELMFQEFWALRDISFEVQTRPHLYSGLIYEICIHLNHWGRK